MNAASALQCLSLTLTVVSCWIRVRGHICPFLQINSRWKTIFLISWLIQPNLWNFNDLVRTIFHSTVATQLLWRSRHQRSLWHHHVPPEKPLHYIWRLHLTHMLSGQSSSTVVMTVDVNSHLDLNPLRWCSKEEGVKERRELHAGPRRVDLLEVFFFL